MTIVALGRAIWQQTLFLRLDYPHHLSPGSLAFYTCHNHYSLPSHSCLQHVLKLPFGFWDGLYAYFFNLALVCSCPSPFFAFYPSLLLIHVRPLARIRWSRSPKNCFLVAFTHIMSIYFHSHSTLSSLGYSIPLPYQGSLVQREFRSFNILGLGRFWRDSWYN